MPHYDEARGLLAAELAGPASIIASTVHAATSKVTPVDADELPLVDSASSFSLKKLTWANLKATLATWLNGGTLPVSFTVNKAVNFYSEAVSVSTPNITATTIKTFAAHTPGVGAYLFTAYVDGGGYTTLAAYALFMVGNASAVILHQVNGAGVLEITLSGMNIQVWQNTGAVQTVKGYLVRINA